MKKLVIKSALLLFLIFITVFAVYISLPESKDALMASIIDKEAILQSTNSPKIVLVGGSNLAFGIDSEMIDNNFNYEVVNTALTGGMGLNYMLSFIKPFLKEGDIVILALEYGLLDKSHKSFEALNRALGESPSALKYVSLFNDPIQPSTFLRTIQRRTLNFLGLSRNSDLNTLSRTGFNKHGDLIEHLEIDPWIVRNKKYSITYKTPKPDIIKLLNDFYMYCQARGIAVYMTVPPLPKPFRNGPGPNGDEWVNNIQEDLLIPIISNPDDYLFPNNYFWGHVYHLNAVGRRERTQLLVNDLKIALEENQN